MGVFGAGPGFQPGQIGKNVDLAAGVPHNALNLGVGGVPRHQQGSPLFFGPEGDVLDLFDKGAGGVVPADSPLAQLVVDAAGHPVAADHHLIPRGQAGGALRHQHPPLFHLGHRLGVMDQGAQGGHLVPPVHQLIGHFHGAVHPKAEPRRLG